MPDLLIELFSEEIPARMQARARDDLRRLVTDGLVAAGLTYRGAQAHSTPRRLALAIDGLAAQSPERIEERKGPRGKEGRGFLCHYPPPGPPGGRDRGRGAGRGDPQFPLAEIHALGGRFAALGAPAAFDPVHPDG
jgi:hypothetical protein